MVLSAYTRGPSPSGPSLANVPGIWAIQVGKPSASQIDIAFTVDEVTASSVHRWATHRRGFEYASHLFFVRRLEEQMLLPTLALTPDASQSTLSLYRPPRSPQLSKICRRAREASHPKPLP
jgi:hypothetical protein